MNNSLTIPAISDKNREKLLWLLASATFIIFFQAYMIAPLIPSLATTFGVSQQLTGILIPAYLIPYAVSTLFFGLLADRFRPTSIITASLTAFVALSFFTSTAANMDQFILWRFLTGVGSSGVIPISVSLTGRLFSFEERGRPLGLLFGAMAGGAAAGSTLGVAVAPVVGWRFLFIGLAILASIALLLLIFSIKKLRLPKPVSTGITLTAIINGYYNLLAQRRGLRTYFYVFCNGIFHSGVFTWLGLYLKDNYGLNEWQIGLALMGYGLPGFIFGPFIGRAADKNGRKRLLPSGILLSALSVGLLALHLPLWMACLLITILSLGYDLSQPLLAGIVTDLGKNQPGQAMGLNVFTLFMGFGLGSLLFGAMVPYGWAVALITFTTFQLTIALFGFKVFKRETNKI
ncbi:MFS transporter [Mucilaginibacter gossypii]|uniref:MFS transporter n=1 Tax=Mucilaginibacter gossypii TaxID=551996 RepID=UPI000DCD9E5D|nr:MULTISPECIES: MFS transporter [Mucilaginibacter]QTE38563.1 MFS transporter [Mucilaginibacter gossypii]RAV52841.1 MFS transporter [Mucilaginibacter rubeus]